MKKYLIFATLIVAIFALSFSNESTTQSKKIPEWKTINYDFPIVVADTLAALQLGSALFHSPGSCATCHAIKNGGFSNDPFPTGGAGLFDYIMFPYQNDFAADKPTIRTPSTIMSDRVINALSGGELGAGGFNSDVSFDKLVGFKDQNALSDNVKGIYVQAPVGNDGHRTTHLVELTKSNIALKKLCLQAFPDKFVNDFKVMVALAAWQQTVQPTESRFAKKTIKHSDGYEVYQKKCQSCHGDELQGQVLAPAVDGSTLIGRSRMTGKASDVGIVKTTPLYNLVDAPCFFWHCEETTLYKAIGICATSHGVEIGRKEQHAVKRFLRDDARDKSLDRYLNFTRTKK